MYCCRADIVIYVYSQTITLRDSNWHYTRKRSVKTVISVWRAHAEYCPNLLLRKGCCCALASVTELSLLGFVQRKSLGRGLDVGGVPPISGDPMPHGLCSSPSSQRGSAPHGCCIPCHKSTFLHNRGKEKWSTHSGSPWFGSSPS